MYSINGNDTVCIFKGSRRATNAREGMAHHFIDEHFINDFLDKCPSGRYSTMKYRGASGRDCFLRHLIHTLNSILD